MLWSRDCLKMLPFVVMQRVAWFSQRQLSYLLHYSKRDLLPLEGGA